MGTSPRRVETRLRTRIALLAALVVAGGPGVARASPKDPGARERAIQLGLQGEALYEKGEYAGALAKFLEADALVHVPTFGLRVARALAKLGRLVEAEARYQEVVAMALDPSWPLVHAKAQEAARAELEALRARVPRARLIVENTPEEPLVVTVDGKPVDLTKSREIPVDPGAHQAEAIAGGARVSARFEVKEGELIDVALTFEPREAAAPAPEPAGSPRRKIRWKPVVRTAGWVALGLGGAGATVGIVSGGLAASRIGELDDLCPERRCPPEAWDQSNSYRTLQRVSTIGLLGGIAAGAAGVGLLYLTDDRRWPDSVDPQATAIAVTPGGVVVRGRF